MTTATLARSFPGILHLPHGTHHSHKDKLGTGVSIALHVLGAATIYFLAVQHVKKTEETPPIELQLVAPEPLPAPPQPVQPVVQQPPEPVAEPEPEEAVEPIVKPKPVKQVQKPKIKPRPTPVKTAPVSDARPVPGPTSPTATPSPVRTQQAAATPGAISSVNVAYVHARIAKTAANNYPQMAIDRNIHGRVGYKLTLTPDGTLVKYEIRSSGSDILDRAAEAALKAAAPFRFEKLPDHGGTLYALNGTIDYQLQEASGLDE